jgi:hypothetical protein
MCARLGEAFVTPKPPPLKRKRHDAPNDRELLIMPCGCWALPIELCHVLGDHFESFVCDAHGVQKITKAWRKRMKNRLGLYERVPSEYGYLVKNLED